MSWLKVKLMKKIRIALIYFFFVVSIFAQQTITIEKYYTGYGEGVLLEEARKNALNNLMTNIQVFISANMDRNLKEGNAGFSDSTTLNITTSSFMQLSDIEEKIEHKDDGLYKVVKLVNKEVVNKQFQKQKENIIGYLKQAEMELFNRKGIINVGMILNSLYNAYLLSIVYPDSLEYIFKYDLDKKPIKTTLITQQTLLAINYIIDRIKFEPVKQIESENITWKFIAKFNGRIISNFNYSYFDGVGEMLGDVKNGETILDFYFDNSKSLERSFIITPEVANEELMDPLLKSLHNVFKSHIMGLGIKCSFEYDNTNEEYKRECDITSESEAESKEEIKTSELKELNPPVVLINLLGKVGNLQELLAELNKMEKGGNIVTGYARDFESLNNLYAVVVDEDKIIGLIKQRAGKCYDYITDRELRMQDYTGKKILWFEILGNKNEK